MEEITECFHQQILLCGRILTLQLLARESFSTRLFVDKRHKVQLLDFQQLQSEITEHLPDAS